VEAVENLQAGADCVAGPVRKGKGGLGGSAPRVSRWLGDIREFFPTPIVQVIQKDAFDRLNLKSLMLEPEFLSTLEADVHLVADLMSLRSAIPEKTKETARMVVRKVVNELLARLEQKTVEIVGGAINRAQRTRRPRHADIDWGKTILANLRHYQHEHRTVVLETLVGYQRRGRTRSDLDHVMLCVDQSGSMASSVVYASIFAAVLASLPGLATQLICFDTAVVDLTEQLKDPVDVLFGVQLGGGTDIDAALAYCEQHIEHPAKTHLILISDLYEGGDAEAMLARISTLKQSGVKLIVLLALSDDGHPAYNNEYAGSMSASAAIARFSNSSAACSSLALMRGKPHPTDLVRAVRVSSCVKRRLVLSLDIELVGDQKTKFLRLTRRPDVAFTPTRAVRTAATDTQRVRLG